MRKPETVSLLKLKLPEEKLKYYRDIGEQSASQIFIKNKTTHKVSSLSPMYMQKSSKKRDNSVKNTQFPPVRNLISCESPSILAYKCNNLSPTTLSPTLPKPPRKINMETSRDISYIKDSFQSQNIKNLGLTSCELPLDIKVVKEIVSSGGQYTNKDTSEATSELLEIEKMWKHNPSGRVESKKLQNWLLKMKEIYQSEHFFTIYSMAAMEITRQVSVHCSERGTALQEILDFFVNSAKNSKKNVEAVEAHTKELKKKVFADFKEKEKKLLEELQRSRELQSYYQQLTGKKSGKLKNLKEKLSDHAETIETLRFSLFADNPLVMKSPKSQQAADSLPRPKKNIITFSRSNTYIPIDNLDQSCQTSLIYSNSLKIDDFAQTDRFLDIAHQGLGIQIYTKIVLPSYRNKRPLLEAGHLQNNRKKKSSTSSSIAYNNRQPKTQNSPLNELCRKINERDKMILMLKNLVDNTGTPGKELTDGKVFPKIVFNQEPGEDLGSLDDYQNGFEAGFETGYQLGISLAEDQTSENESFTDSNEEKSEVFEDSLSFKSENSDENWEEAEKNQEKLKIHTEKVRKSVLKSILANPELSGGHSPKHSVIPLSKIVDFNFNERFYKHSKRSVPLNILENILEKKPAWLKSKANISKKMLNKQISTFYQAYYAKSDYSEPLLHFVYEDIQQKSGLKKLGKKKFVHFLCSLIIRSSSLRTNHFLRFIGAGWVISQGNFSHFSLKFYLDCLTFLLSSKNGIAIIDESADTSLIPVSRAHELLKEKLELQKKGSQLACLIDENTILDPKKFNKCGMIEQELFISFIMQAYEEVVLKILENVEVAINSIKFAEDQSTLSNLEAKMILRKFSQDKLEELPHNELFIEDFCSFCVKKNIFIEDVKCTLQSPVGPAHEVLISVQRVVDELRKKVKSVKLIRPDDYKVLKQKLNVLSTSLHKRDPYDCFLASEIYKSEVNPV